MLVLLVVKKQWAINQALLFPLRGFCITSEFDNALQHCFDPYYKSPAHEANIFNPTVHPFSCIYSLVQNEAWGFDIRISDTTQALEHICWLLSHTHFLIIWEDVAPTCNTLYACPYMPCDTSSILQERVTFVFTRVLWGSYLNSDIPCPQEQELTSMLQVFLFLLSKMYVSATVSVQPI